MGGFVKPVYQMKTLDEKAAEYAASVVAAFPSLKNHKGTIETVYGQAVVQNEALESGELGTFGKALISLKRGFNVRRKSWVKNGDMFIVKQIDSDISPDIVPKMQSLPDAAKAEIKKHADGSIHYHTQCLIVYPHGMQGATATNYIPDWLDMFANDWMIAE